MTGRVLIVDDVAANRELLESYLTSEYFEVVAADSGEAALEICLKDDIELVILDIMMPGIDGFDVCRQMKGNPQTHHIPVIMITVLDRPEDRVQGIDAGADDFLQKPVDRTALIMRVKNLMRIKRLVDELRVRANAAEEAGLRIESGTTLDMSGEGGRILLVEKNEGCRGRIREVLGAYHEINEETDPKNVLDHVHGQNIDVALISLEETSDFNGLRLCSQLRASDKSRNIPLIVIVDPLDAPLLLRALDMGVNDYIARPIDQNELRARVSMQLKRARYVEKLRHDFQQNMELAVTDSLTGLYNRRYLENYLEAILKEVQLRKKELSILICDVDHFKAINDTHGHDTGDIVLREVARRLRNGVRGVNLVCRYGGEEFVVVLSDIGLEQGANLADRLRRGIMDAPFHFGSESLSVTISIGISSFQGDQDSMTKLFKRADQALYIAKEQGRNRVAIMDAAPANEEHAHAPEVQTGKKHQPHR